MIDIGVNLTSPQFAGDLDAVLARARAAGVRGALVTGTDLESSAAAQLLADQHDDLWCTAGIHPHDAARAPLDFEARLRDLARHPRVRAIGETGLDFNRNFSPATSQRRVFLAQIRIATELGMPLFVHERDTAGEVCEMLVANAGSAVVIHCFTGSACDLERCLDAGYHIGITGWVCDRRRGATLRKLVPSIPDDRLLVETDAPYLMPHGAHPPDPLHKRRNEPSNLGFVVAELARLRGRTAEVVAAQTEANAIRLFGLDKPRD